MVNLMELNPSIAAIQPKLLALQQNDTFEYAGASGGYIDRFGFPFCRGRIFDHLEKDQNQYNDNKKVFWASGAALFIDAELYHKLGGLDEDFFAHMEEIDLCWRLQNAGHEIWICPDSIVYHLGGGTLQKTNPRKTYYNFSNKVFSVIAFRIILDHIAALRFLMQGKWGDFKAIVSAHRHFILKYKYWKTKRVVHDGNQAYFGEEVYKGSIVWAHFKRKVKTFSGLGMK